MGDFRPTGTTATVTKVTKVNARIYDVTVSGGNLADLNRRVGLNLRSSQNITDVAGNALPTVEPAADQTYLVVNTALLASFSAAQSLATATLAADSLNPLIVAATERWKAAGVGEDELNRLRQVKLAVIDLPGDMLGSATANTIWLDHNAAGHGWFVDTTPADDVEFSADFQLSTRNSERRMDVLTVLLHEQGHLMGLGHNEDFESDDLMSELLAPGDRRSPTKEHRDAVFGELDWLDMMLNTELL